MYNGIGLSTVRGSGTNGYVQRNLSHVRPSKDKVNYKTEEDIQKAEAQISRGPNQGILDHERKRKLEVKCLELEEVLRDQGYEDEEVAEKVQAYRQMLMGKINNSLEIYYCTIISRDALKLPITRESFLHPKGRSPEG